MAHHKSVSLQRRSGAFDYGCFFLMHIDIVDVVLVGFSDVFMLSTFDRQLSLVHQENEGRRTLSIEAKI